MGRQTFGRKEERTDNKGLAKVAVQWFTEHLCFVSSAVLADSLVLRNRHHRQAPLLRNGHKAARRYGQPILTTLQQIN
ncbi:MAG: hypothetical protein LC116_08170 [Bacteroidetes bacterium]|nr:hypothetical protein [Bacteroidota bacterium]